MPSDSSNDNGERRAPDAHGEAALLLVESLIHGLVARKVISVHDAVEVAEVAADAGTESEAERRAVPAQARSAEILSAIGASLSHDLPGGA